MTGLGVIALAVFAVVLLCVAVVQGLGDDED